MTNEELKYLTALQAEFVKRMGPRAKVFDKFIDEYGELGIIVKYEDGTLIVAFNGELEKIPSYFWAGKVIRIPLAIDSDGPDGRPSGRCLWGMVDWDLFSVLSPNLEGEWYIHGMMGRRTSGFSSEWCAPCLALLKALAHQWNVEVKGNE